MMTSTVTSQLTSFGYDLVYFELGEYSNLISLPLMFTKLDMIDNPLVLTNYFECRHDDVTADQFRLEFSIF